MTKLIQLETLQEIYSVSVATVNPIESFLHVKSILEATQSLCKVSFIPVIIPHSAQF